MKADQAEIVDQAIGWHIRLAKADENGWSEFIAWLEASPAHAAAYDQLATNDRLITNAEFPVQAGNDNGPSRRVWWTAGGMAAALALTAVLVPSLLAPSVALQSIATANGERRTVSLADGTRIELSGGTSIRLNPADARVVMLDGGEAVFHVRHDARHPFTVTAGGVTVRDVGTVFNLANTADRLTLAVAEGAVLFRPEQEAISLGAGHALTLDRQSGKVEKSQIATSLVGGWRTGGIAFESAFVRDVTASLTRLYGTPLEVDPGLSDQPFTGMVRFTGIADRDVPHLAELIGATSRRVGNHWILSPKS